MCHLIYVIHADLHLFFLLKFIIDILNLSLSSADVRTQAMYQLLDNGFIGLIFSCYSEDSLKVCCILTTLQHGASFSLIPDVVFYRWEEFK